jgi:hypothetical protein
MNDVGNLHETGLVLQKCKKPSPGIFRVSYFDDKTGRFFMLELSIGILAPDNFLEDHLRGSCQGGIDTAERIPRTCKLPQSPYPLRMFSLRLSARRSPAVIGG